MAPLQYVVPGTVGSWLLGPEKAPTFRAAGRVGNLPGCLLEGSALTHRSPCQAPLPGPSQG